MVALGGLPGMSPQAKYKPKVSFKVHTYIGVGMAWTDSTHETERGARLRARQLRRRGEPYVFIRKVTVELIATFGKLPA